MKFLNYSILISLLINSATLIEAADDRSNDEATFNIEDDRDSNNINSLRDDAEVPVIIMPMDPEGTSMAMSVSVKVNAMIKGGEYIAASVLKRDIQALKENPHIKAVLADEPMYVVGEKEGNLRNLAEDDPYGIGMVLQDMEFWKGLGEPSGSIKVCVADTGYGLGHNDLPGKPDVDGTSNTAYPGYSWDTDAHGHGTHCSGTVAAIGDNSNGVVGVIPNNMGGKFQLLISNALSGTGSGSTSGVMAAVTNCVNQGAKVISLSLGGGSSGSDIADFYQNYFDDDGILFVAAAGNGGSSSKLYPASFPALMSVAAIDSNKNKASFSQYNDQVEISGPGVGVTSTIPNDQYATWSGTSMATPHVAGVAGLLWMYYPDCTNYQIRNALLKSAEDLGDNGCDEKYGYGLVQAKAAYDLLANNCGGEIGETTGVGGCKQLYGEPECATDADCDDGDSCTVDTCDGQKCNHSFDCASCGKVAPVSVIITSDKYPGDISYDIKDTTDTTIMSGNGFGEGTRTDTQCFANGDYTFTIYDSYGDGLCCSYGNGGYIVTVNDVEVASGAEYTDKDVKDFSVGSSPTVSPVTPPTVAPVTPPTVAPVTPPTVAPVTSPTSSPVNPPITSYPTHTAPTMYPTHKAPTPYPTEVPPTPYPTGGNTCGAQGEACKRHTQCCGGKCNKIKGICRK